jgi:hypothetical protein
VEHICICVCADDSDLRVKNRNTINKNLLDSSVEGGVSEYMKIQNFWVVPLYTGRVFPSFAEDSSALIFRDCLTPKIKAL